MKNVKKIVILMTPILLFAILFVPYSLVNQHFIVDWLGCGCPVIDETGNMVENNFNANDFTALFWLFVSACVTAISAFLSKIIPKEKVWLRVLYIVGMLVLSILITYQFCQMMMWNWPIPICRAEWAFNVMWFWCKFGATLYATILTIFTISHEITRYSRYQTALLKLKEIILQKLEMHFAFPFFMLLSLKKEKTVWFVKIEPFYLL